MPEVGADTGTWGGIINSNVFTFLDAFLGNTLAVAMTSTNVTLTISQWQNNGVFLLQGVLTANLQLILPLSPNSVGSATAVGGKFVVDNETTGDFTVTVLTAATASTGVVAPQGSRTSLYSDSINVWFADDSRVAKLFTFAGNPNGAVTGIAGNPAAETPADVIWDSTDQVIYVSNGGTSWTPVNQSLPTPQGYLTPVSMVPIATGDVVGAATVYWTPYFGNLCPVFNGSSFQVFSFSELALALAPGSQLAGGVYDVFAFDNAGVLQVGFGPSWLTGAVAGSVTPGSCARGTGAGSTQISRLNGILVNTNAITLNNGATSYAGIAASQCTYLGSVAVDGANGQVSFYRSWGGGSGTPIRKWGAWNYYNRAPIKMQQGIASPTGWSYASTTFRQSNADALSAIMGFVGVAEEIFTSNFSQTVQVNNPATGSAKIGIGLNSTTATSAYVPLFSPLSNNNEISWLRSNLIVGPLLGLNQFNTLEGGGAGAGFLATIVNMLSTLEYRG